MQSQIHPNVEAAVLCTRETKGWIWQSVLYLKGGSGGHANGRVTDMSFEANN